MAFCRSSVRSVRFSMVFFTSFSLPFRPKRSSMPNHPAMPLSSPCTMLPTSLMTSMMISGSSSTTLFIVSATLSSRSLIKPFGSSPNASSIWSMAPTMPPTFPPSSPNDLPMPSEPLESEVISLVMPLAKPYSEPSDISFR